MSKMKHVVLLGAGAIGVLPAAKLAGCGGVKLTVAADAERVARYRKDGIFLNGEKLPFGYASPEELEIADLIIVATKMTTLGAALENVVQAVNENTVFLPLLNGISARDVISARFPQCRVLGGFHLGHASVRVGNRVTHDGVGTIYCGGEGSALDFVTGLLKSAGVDVEAPDNFEVAMWQKFVLNVGINQTQAFFQADYGKVQHSPEMLRMVWDLMEEAVAVGKACGVALGDEVIDSAMMVVCKMPPQVKTSMLQDVEAGRETEVDAFAGTVCRLAEKYNIEVPKNRLVLEKVRGAPVFVLSSSLQVENEATPLSRS